MDSDVLTRLRHAIDDFRDSPGAGGESVRRATSLARVAWAELFQESVTRYATPPAEARRLESLLKELLRALRRRGRPAVRAAHVTEMRLRCLHVLRRNGAEALDDEVSSLCKVGKTKKREKS